MLYDEMKVLKLVVMLMSDDEMMVVKVARTLLVVE